MVCDPSQFTSLDLISDPIRLALLTLHGTRLVNSVQIPLTKYRPISTAISFTIDAPDISVRLSLPRWNTHSIYPIPQRTDIGRIGNFHLDASYRYFADVHPENIDQLVLDFMVSQVNFLLWGWHNWDVFRLETLPIRRVVGLSDTSWFYGTTILALSHISQLLTSI